MEIKNAYLAGIPPETKLAKFICKILGAKTFHWVFLIRGYKDKILCSESINKGTSITNFNYQNAYIYRLKNLKYEPHSLRLINYHADVGWYEYDNMVNFRTAVWFILKHYFKKIIPVIPNHKFNCQENVCYLCERLGFQIIPPYEHPFCINLEHSPELELIGEIINGEISYILGENRPKYVTFKDNLLTEPEKQSEIDSGAPSVISNEEALKVDYNEPSGEMPK